MKVFAIAPFRKSAKRSRPNAKPEPADLRVRVQAEVSTDYSSITFFVDAGKVWNKPPVYTLSEVVTKRLGQRREEIFKHIENIRTICEGRLEATDQQGNRLIDIDLLPEPNPICGTATLNLEPSHKDSAEALGAASDYLYKDLWSKFCEDFDFNLCDIAGKAP
jgi:hypothetical protein